MEKQEKSNIYTPPYEMRLFAQALLSEGVKGNKTRAQEISGVNKGRFYYYWETSPHKIEFRKWFSEKCDEVLGINEAIPPYALMSEIVKGNIEAIKTYYKLMGKLRENPLIDQSKHITQQYVVFRNPVALKEEQDAQLQTR